nr:immunoglobulin heavy chain junction region [Macaca mulatta]MOY22061.1 immunoglobulin heavy chain junction region [Macaca mulatta]MOY23116.1 immunoglobulin heavy chain junction region [Macaca mulatta]MOY30379.1 immunoglobulin heavy chain junction region [Macaca mulatta]
CARYGIADGYDAFDFW